MIKNMRYMGAVVSIALSLILAPFAASPARDAQAIAVEKLSGPPIVDGKLDEWGSEGWNKITIKPAAENDTKNRTGTINVELKSGIVDDTLFIAVRWPDNAEDTNYRPWVWKRKKYRRGKDRDDMFAIRFDMEGDFHQCMVADADYKVDVWLWSAGRSNPAGRAEDMWHVITTKIMEDAAEYESPTGKTVYIKKHRDEGESIYNYLKPKLKEFKEDSLPSVDWVASGGSGSLVDVEAKGVWADGTWSLELRRKLDTGNKDDVAFILGESITTQIAVFNNTNSDHKSVSAPLDLSIPN